MMFEGSASDVHGGVIENVEARNCQGCFSGYPANGLYQTGNICAASVCLSDEPERGGKNMVNLWTAGDNNRDGVLAYDITVEDSYYYDPCPDDEGRLYWEARKGEIFTGGEPDITELQEWTPRENLVLNFSWDDCDLDPPFVDCWDWEWQDIGHELIRYNVNDSSLVEIDVWGHCWP